MANKIKETVDYFPFFVSDGRTFYLLKKKYGVAGIGMFAELCRLLSRTPGHVYSMRDELDRERMIDFIGCKDHPVSESEMFAFLDVLASTGKIDRDVWENKRLIISRDFLDSLSEAYRQRKGEKPTFENVKKECEEFENIQYHPSENESTGNIPGISRDNSGNITECPVQIKEKKRKEEKTRESISGEKKPENNDSTPAAPQPPPAVSEGAVIDFPDKKQLSPMKNDTANLYQQMFTQIFPHEAWSDYAKERKQLSTLGKKTEKLLETVPQYETEKDLAIDLFNTFMAMKKNGDKFEQKQPVVPSAMSNMWSRIIDQLARGQPKEDDGGISIEDLAEVF